MVLVNVEHILIRLSYIDATEREVELTNVVMDSAGVQDTGLGSASLVEKCMCPVGYVGDSCESCAPGFEHQSNGAWLGRCAPIQQERCSQGTYGDPRRGIPCRECPCPHTGANNFASGCQLAPDGEINCNCNEGYVGRRCEYCAPGYQGNPLESSCTPIPESECNAEGTLRAYRNGTCDCKPLVEGSRCDRCASKSFHLNSFVYTGCIECFCSGLTKDCTSSSWYRDVISSTFGYSTVPHGFDLISDYETARPQSVQFEEGKTSLQFSQQSITDPLYWSLPPRFLDNKITAYGGKLNYTLSYNPLPGGHMSRNNAPDVVIKSGEDLTIIHYRKSGVNPSQSSSYAVPIIESAWQRSDGQGVDREHLLMALSKIDAIYIKATYTTGTKDGALTHVSLDIAKQNYISSERAVEVEECRCPTGYKGLSCERCDRGYKRIPEEGLYLGVCEPCTCNHHSDQCDSETGECHNCDHNTEGHFCDSCAPGFIGNASAGTPYDCYPVNDNNYTPPDEEDSENLSNCANCNQAGTRSCDNGQCQCKSNVYGLRCDQCRPGTYDLTKSNSAGCQKCYCSDKSQICHTSSLYRQLIPIDFLADIPLITDENGNSIDTSSYLQFNISSNSYTYNRTSFEPLYWSLRGAVLGNQLNSYGGKLSYNLITDSYGRYVSGNDVILIGNGLKLLWSRPDAEENDPNYDVPLNEDANWSVIDRGQSNVATHYDIMSVLSNLEHILIRAVNKIPTKSSTIRNVILESAIESPNQNGQLATDIEVCTCPSGYKGNSCEYCDTLHYRDVYNNCQACPCQEENTQSCNLNVNEYPECQCKSGYTGDRCQYDENQVYPGPTTSEQPPIEYDYRTQIEVSISKPNITIIPVGGSLTLFCAGRMALSRTPVLVQWYKLNGEMPASYDIDSGYLRLYDLQVYDSGTYKCQAVNNETAKIFEDQILITISEESQRTKAHIDYLPERVEFEEFQPNEIDCVVGGNPQPIVTWARVHGQMSNEARTEGSRLILASPRVTDTGSYRCYTTNDLGDDQADTEIIVRPAAIVNPPPTREHVYIDPPSYNGQAGNTVHLECILTRGAPLVYEWRKDGYPIYRQRNVIIDSNIIEIRDTTPHDSGIYTCVGIDQRAPRNYTADVEVNILPISEPEGTLPTVTIYQKEYEVEQGFDINITCLATGTPYPRISWSLIRNVMAENVHPVNNVLQIIKARRENDGMYVCIAQNSVGSNEASTHLRVIPRERPAVQVYMINQIIPVGNEGSLYCVATGIPEPRIEWRRVSSRPLPTNIIERNGQKIIENIQVADSDVYECIATNEVGEDTGNVTIRVIEEPSVQVYPRPQDLRLHEGDNVTINCYATGTPTPIVQWLNYDETPIRSENPLSNAATLNIQHIRSDDPREYRCRATNLAGFKDYPILLDVISSYDSGRGDIPYENEYQPQPYPDNIQNHTAYTGERVELNCSLINEQDLGEKLETIWDRTDGQEISVDAYFDRQIMIIEHANQNHSGIYRCTGYDEGTPVAEYVTRLEILNIPHITFYPEIPIRVQQYEKVKIACEVTGEQPIRVSWHAQNNRPLPPTVEIDGPYLIFSSITPSDAGVYYCTAINRYGNATERAEIVVDRGASYTLQPKARKHFIEEGKNVRLLCEISPPIRDGLQYNWRREDGKPLPRNVNTNMEVLFLPKVRQEDNGRYICEVYGRGKTFMPSIVDLIIERRQNVIEYPCMVFYICAELRSTQTIQLKTTANRSVSYTCQPNDFKCISHPHTCVQASMVCDGIYDCTDHSDEFNCTNEPPPAPVKSKTSIFKRNKKNSKHTTTSKTTEQHTKYRELAHEPQMQQKYPRPTYQPREQSLKLDQQHSKLYTGQSTEVECYSSDGSYTDVVWERSDGSPLPPHIQQTDNRLVITSAMTNDAGHYLCKCRTDAGDLYTTSFELEVEPRILDTTQPEIVHEAVGKNVNLPCMQDFADDMGNSYRWSRLYGQIQPNRDLSNPKLNLKQIQANDAGVYVCTVTTPDGHTREHLTTLVVTGIIPQFNQAPLSYMVFPKLADANVRVNFDITFRAEEPNGLLLFNGQNQGSGDYIALSLSNGYPEFRFDFDNTPMIVRAEMPISMHEWHTIHVNRFRRDGYMQVDDQHPIALPTLHQVSQLNLVDDLYIGGVPSWNILPINAVEEQIGFVGCISRLTLQGTTVDLIKEAKYKEDVTACEPCADNPCQNSGICMESQTEMAYSCMCQTGWTGRNCAISGTQCAPGICGLGSCENTEFGMDCLCPLNRTGDRCQYVEHLNENSISFRSNGFAAYDPPRASKLHIKFQVRPNSLKNSILLYASESKLPSGDYIAVVLQDEHVELMINMGARLNPVIVRSQNPLPINKWTEIEISRRLGESILRVGYDAEQRGKASGLARTLNIKTPLYVGGYDYQNVKVNRDINITKGFDGCIAKLTENKRQIHLIANIKDAANVQNCGETNEVDESYTLPNSMEPSSHKNDMSQVTCDSDPCENNGTCVMVDNQAQCNCLIRFTGKRCEEHIMLEYDAKFHGNGYLELNRNQFNETVEQTYSFASMVFSTSQPNGLLLWWGQKNNEEFSGQDFMALAVVNGIIEFSFRLNGEETFIRNHEKRVDDGQRHIVIIKRTDNTGLLEIDHLQDAGETRPTGTYTMRLPGHVFIGGAPDIEKLTGGRYTTNFDGCVHVVEGAISQIININRSAVSGINVDNCPQTKEEIDTEPPVV